MKNFHNCRFSAIKLTVTVCLFAAFFISNDIKAEVLYQDIQDPSEIGVEGLTGINTIQEDETESQNKGYTKKVVGIPRGRESSYYRDLFGEEEDLVTPFQLPEDFGKSKYDYNAKTVADLANLDNLRAQYQGAFVKLMNGLGKAAVTAGTSFVDAAGLLFGIEEAIRNRKWSKLWDNEIMDFTSKIEKWSEEAMTNYKTESQQAQPWYAPDNLFSANFLGDKVIKNLGFIAGTISASTLGAGSANVLGKAMGMACIFYCKKCKSISAIDAYSDNKASFSKIHEDIDKTKVDSIAALDDIRAQHEQENLKNWLLGAGIVIFIFFIVIIVIKYISNKTEKATRESPKSKVIVENAPKPNKNDAPKGTEKGSKEKIIEDLQILSNAIQEDNIELAKEKIEQIRNAIKNTNIEEDLAKSIDAIINDFEKNYRNGISDPFEFSYVDYTYPAHFIQGDNWDYAVAKFPSKGTFVFPYRRRKIERRGYMEDSFQSYLENKLSKSNLLVLGDCAILPADNILPYEPDIAIIDNEHPSLRIDIEIDEPYAAITNKPIHYIGCGDDFRDMNLNNLGWIVVRFTEFQVYSDMPGCASFVAQLIHSLNPSKPLPESLLTQNFPQTQKRWRENEATVMAAEKVREKYLNHEFGISEPDEIIDTDIKQNDIKQNDIKQNDKEKEATKLVQPLKFPTPKPKPKPTPKLNKPESKSSVIDERDKHIQFLPQEHIYLYNGREQLTPVSSVVSCFFNRFDSYYRSECQAKQRGVPQGLVLEEWDSIGERSREVGTFMHQQIENHYNGLPYQQTFSFRYKGKYIHLEEEISLELEYMQFTEFLKNHRFSPFRTEWAIYDEKLKIAGTIDMIHKREDVFDIYDWKRSYRIVDFSGNPIAENSYGKKGLGVLNQIDDTPYWHYCIQQNLYRYILEQNYGIRIEKMYLVVFGDNITEYCKLDVPRMDKTIDSMVKSLRKS